MNLSKSQFEQAYDQVILKNDFFERDSYYIQYKPRYWNTLKHICQCTLPDSARILEIVRGKLLYFAKTYLTMKELSPM